MTKLTLQDKRDVYLGIAKYVDEVCRNNGIKYFLSCGTLLGAIRHKGFIPWDDDFDIMMLREDYEKFVILVNDERYKLINCYTSKEYEHCFSRVYDSQTYSMNKWVRREGLGVDLYVLDAIPQDEIGRKELSGRILRNWTIKIKLNRVRAALKKLRIWPHKDDRFYLMNYFVRRGADLQKSFHGQTEYVACYAGYREARTTLQKEWFKDTIPVKFENCKFLAPLCYHEYLTADYGDYMQMPPEEQRTPYHGGVYYWIEQRL